MIEKRGAIMRKAFTILVLSLFCASAQPCFAQEAKSGGRIDFYSEDMKFSFKDVKSNGAVQPAQWLPQKKDWTKSWIAQAELTSKGWEQLWVEFVPEGTGFVYIILRGSLYPDNKTNHHEVYVDDVLIEGEKVLVLLGNGSFEDQDKLGNPVAWGGPPGKKLVGQMQTLAHSGNYSMLVWHDAPIVQRIMLKSGIKYRVSAWFKAYTPE